MSIPGNRKPFDDALWSADEAELPIESWTLDDFDQLAELGTRRAAWTDADELNA